MAHYVLRYRGEDPQQADIDLIERSAGVTILDRSAPHLLLVDAPERTAQELRERLRDWVVAEEKRYPPPGPARKRVRDEDPPGAA